MGQTEPKNKKGLFHFLAFFLLITELRHNVVETPRGSRFQVVETCCLLLGLAGEKTFG